MAKKENVSEYTEKLQRVIYDADQIRRTLIVYMKDGGEVVSREILPVSVKDGYVFAFCLLHKELHSFKLDRIISMTSTGHIRAYDCEVKI